MADNETYTVVFTKNEIWSLNEILANFRKTYSDVDNPKDHPVFKSAAKLNYKIAMILMPEAEGKITLDDYMEA